MTVELFFTHLPRNRMAHSFIHIWEVFIKASVSGLVVSWNDDWRSNLQVD